MVNYSMNPGNSRFDCSRLPCPNPTSLAEPGGWAKTDNGCEPKGGLERLAYLFLSGFAMWGGEFLEQYGYRMSVTYSGAPGMLRAESVQCKLCTYEAGLGRLGSLRDDLAVTLHFVLDDCNVFTGFMTMSWLWCEGDANLYPPLISTPTTVLILPNWVSLTWSDDISSVHLLQGSE